MNRALLTLLLVLPAALPGQIRQAAPPPGAGNVSLPLDEYNRLLDQATRMAKPVEAPPQAYSLRSVELNLDVTSGKAMGRMILEGEVLAKGSVKVPLTTGVTVLDAQQRGQELALLQEGGVHSALLTGPGEFAIQMEAGFPLTIDAGRATFKVPVPVAGVARLTLTVPGDNTNVSLSSGLITSRGSAGGKTTIQATLVPGQEAAIWWATRESVPVAVPKQVRFLSDIKTLVSVRDGQLALAALIDITVIQGNPAQFQMALPAGYEVTGAAGATLESTDTTGGVLVLRLANPVPRSHQFLVSLERATSGTQTEVPMLGMKDSQRETGEVLVEGEGTVELAAKESGGLRRMDLKEVSPVLRALSHDAPQAAFRHHRQPSEPLGLALEWVRFPGKNLVPAVVQEAVATTMVTPEGKSLTEVKLHLRNSAQPFLRVVLPPGANIVSADVGGQNVKPVLGADGSRVPLLRPGFRPAGQYSVSFVYMDSGTPFAKKGGAEVSLPKMDVPIGLLRWEVFLPERYKVANFSGNAFSAMLLPIGERAGEREEPAVELAAALDRRLRPGDLGGFVTDLSSAVIHSVEVAVVSTATGMTRRTTTDGAGHWLVRGIPSGPVRVTLDARGFRQQVLNYSYDANQPVSSNVRLDVGSVSETVEVTAEASMVRDSKRIEDQIRKNAETAQNTASVNVVNLQRRIAGVLPIAVEVPRAGMSFRFVRPLVTDEPTKVAFTYKTR